MALETEPWDPAVRLSAPEAQAAYLEAAFEDGDPDLIVAAIGDVARARGMSSVAGSASVSREALYKAFRPGGNPTLATLASVMKALGYRLSVAPVLAAGSDSRPSTG
ncbi:MAG: putative addiction module antidote protein [Rhodospirillaceae bacterium]|nr:putative addiction module antidote protein [Rhodospirillaceae bacterium]MDE0619383.1 putative addiction module antidote protein [Rhodospirillaceae bacterium]